MTRTNRWAGHLIAGALVVALAGCGSDETGAPVATDPPAISSVQTEPATDSVADSAADSVAAPVDSDPPTSTDDDGGADPTEDDPCAALATVDLDGLLGEPAGMQQPEASDWGDGCTVVASDEESRGRVSLSVSANAPAANYENAREQFGVDAEITGLGELAFASGPMLFVLAGDRLVTLQAIRWSGLDVEGVTQAELEVAMSEVLAALPSGTATPAGLACALLADIDIEGLIGEPVGAPLDEGDGGTDECVLEPESPDSTAYASLTIVDVNAAQSFAESQDVFGVDSTVEALGDEAFHSGPVLAVLDGDRAVFLWIMGDVLAGANVDDADLEAAMAQVLAGVGGG